MVDIPSSGQSNGVDFDSKWWINIQQFSDRQMEARKMHVVGKIACTSTGVNSTRTYSQNVIVMAGQFQISRAAPIYSIIYSLLPQKSNLKLYIRSLGPFQIPSLISKFWNGNFELTLNWLLKLIRVSRCGIKNIIVIVNSEFSEVFIHTHAEHSKCSSFILSFWSRYIKWKIGCNRREPIYNSEAIVNSICLAT